jgi:hypothetical protein
MPRTWTKFFGAVKVMVMNWIKLTRDRLNGKSLVYKVMNPQFLLGGEASVSFSRIFKQRAVGQSVKILYNSIVFSHVTV